VLPLLYLHGLSSSDFAPALTQFLGTSHGLSAATITRLTKDWQDEATAFNKRSLADTDYVYLWVDGIHLEVRLEQDKVCLLVMIGVRADGTKELVALTDGHRESSESWADLLRDCKRRGMAAPVLAIGDGALGLWAALGDVFPATREQRCWFHKIANVLNALPKSAQPGAKAALAEIWNAEDREHAEAAARSFVAEYGTKWPKAVAKLTDDLDVLVEFYNYPAEHWVHLRTTNPLWVDLRHRPPSAAGHQGARIAGGRRGDGVQAHRVRPATVACRQRTPPRRSRPGRSPVREGPPGRTSRRIRRRSASRMTRQSRRS
jgi:putative transposase